MAVTKLLIKQYEGLSTDDKPTGVIAGTTFRETDTRATYITYDGTNWIVADKRVRIVNEDGSFLDLPQEFDDLIAALAAGFLAAATAVALAAVKVVVDAIKVVVDVIQAKTDAIPILAETGGTLTTDGNEQNVYISDVPSGIFKPLAVKIDFTAHTAGETVVVKVYYRIKTGGDYILQDSDEYAGLVDPELVNVGLEANRYGVKVTMEKTVGTNRAYDWAVIYEAVP